MSQTLISEAQAARAFRAIALQVDLARALPLAEQPGALTRLLAGAVVESRRVHGPAVRMDNLRAAGFASCEIIELIDGAIALVVAGDERRAA